MDAWVDIYNVAGTRVGSGPITTVVNWHQERKIKQAGSYTLTMSASDPQRSYLVQNGTLFCYQIVGGVVTEIGAGIIEKIEETPGDPTLINVSGVDLLGELARYSVGDLQVKVLAWNFLTANKGAVKQLNPHWDGVVDPSTGSNYAHDRYDEAVDLANAYDGNVSTETGTVIISSEHDNLWGTQHWLYIGTDARIDRMRFTLGTKNTTQAATLRIQHSADSGWYDLGSFTDGTASAGKPMAQNGDITFTRPTTLARMDAAHGAGNWFWYRIGLTTGNNVHVQFTIKEIEVYGDTPTTTGVALITAIANTLSAGAWATVSTATTNEEYMEFGGETVLAALIALADASGDNFKLTTGRTLVWLGAASTWASSGIRAIGNVTGIGAEGGVESILISDVSKLTDTTEFMSRIAAFAGSGVSRISLANTDNVAPLGYTLVKTPTSPELPYLKNDAAEAAKGIICKVVHFDNIEVQESDSWYQHPTYASNSLFDAAYNYLKARCVDVIQYRLNVVGLKALIALGTTMHVVYQEWKSGVKTLDINTYPSSPLYVMGVAYDVNEEGILVGAVEVSNVEILPDSGAGRVVDAVQSVNQVLMNGGKTVISNTLNISYNDIISNNTNITGGKIDGTLIGSRQPSSGVFDGLTSTGSTWLNGYTIVGGILDVVVGQGILKTAMAIGATSYDFQRPMTPNDYIMIRSAKHGYPTEYIQIGSLVTGTTYNISRGTDGSSAAAWAANDLFVILGHAGNGRLRIRSDGAPSLMVYEQGATADDYVVQGKFGDLNGHYGYAVETWGLGLGEYAASKANMVYDTTNGLRLRIFSTTFIQLTNSGDVLIEGKVQLKGASSSLAIGVTPPTAAGVGTGIWLDRTGIYGLAASVEKFKLDAATGLLTATGATLSGAITATSGTIGGWEVTSTYLRKEAIAMTSAGLVPGDYPFYAGEVYANRATAPFRVSLAGALVATSATITGTITSSAGTIGGFSLGANLLAAGTGATRVAMQSDGGFWAGATAQADAPFSVTVAGVIKASSGTVGGAALGATTIGSTTFVAGTTGWRITNTGEAEFNNIVARGAIISQVLQYGSVMATNGSLWVVPAAGKTRASVTSVDSPTTFNVDIADPDGITHAAAGTLWAASQYIRIKEPLIGDLWASISSTTDMTTYWRLVVVKQSPAAGTNYTFTVGASVLNYGASASGSIRLTADATNSPYISIATHAGAPWSTLTERVRLGNITGLTGVTGTQYGIWMDNGYIGGTIAGTLAMGASGSINIGSGKVLIDANGISLSGETSYTVADAIKMYHGTDLVFAQYQIVTDDLGYNNTHYMNGYGLTGHPIAVDIGAYAVAASNSQIALRSYVNSVQQAYLLVNSTDGITLGAKTRVDHIGEATASHGVVIDNVLKADHFAENTGSHTVTFDNHISMAALKNFRGASYTIADDAATSFTLGFTQALIMFTTTGSTQAFGMALCWPTAGTAYCIKAYGGTQFQVWTGALAGTTKTDGNLNISCHTDTNVYIENRLGGSVTVYVTIFGGS